MLILASTLSWELQTLLWKFLPGDRQVSLTLCVFGFLLALSLVALMVGRWSKRSWLTRPALALAALVTVMWAALWLARPAWLRIADWTLPIVLVATPVSP